MGQSWPAGYSVPTSAIVKQIRCEQKKLFELDAMEKAVNYKAVLYRANLKWGQHSRGKSELLPQPQGSDTLSVKLHVRNY